jgi:RHS repeat-associated protein
MREESYMIGTPYRVAHQLRCGEQQASGNNPTPYGTKGQWGYYTDGETGLLMRTHRYLDSTTGRFSTRDPMGVEGACEHQPLHRNGTGSRRTLDRRSARHPRRAKRRLHG